MKFNKLATKKSQADNGLTPKQMALATLLAVAIGTPFVYADLVAFDNSQHQATANQVFEIPYSASMGIDNYDNIQKVANVAVVAHEFKNGHAVKYFNQAESVMAKNGISDDENTVAKIHVTKDATLKVALALQDMDNHGIDYKQALENAYVTVGNYQKVAYNAYESSVASKKITYDKPINYDYASGKTSMDDLFSASTKTEAKVKNENTLKGSGLKI